MSRRVMLIIIFPNYMPTTDKREGHFVEIYCHERRHFSEVSTLFGCVHYCYKRMIHHEE